MTPSVFSSLSAAIWMPIAFGLFVLAWGRDQNAGVVRAVSLVGALLSFLITIPLVTGFDTSSADMQFGELAPWIERFNVHYRLGVDGLSVWFIPLTAFITVVVILAGWEVIKERVAHYMACLLYTSPSPRDRG